MNRIIVGLCVLAFSSISAMAAQATKFNWNGVYLGAHAGWGKIADVEQTFLLNGDKSGQFSGTGFIGGATIGVNWQSGLWVVGLEGDYSASNVRAETLNAPLCMIGNSGACLTEINSLFTFRARAGYLINNVLIYGTGGLAYGAVTSGINVPAGYYSAKKYEAGWTVGAGIETPLGNYWSAKLEYLYVDLSVPTYTVPGPFQFESTDARTHIIRFGLNYRFGN